MTPTRFIFLAILGFTIHAQGASCVAQASANWNAPSTWTSCAGGVPASGDTATVEGFTVTVPLSVFAICGQSLAAGNVAIEFGTTGAVVVASGGTLILRGDGQYTAAGSGTERTDYLTVQGGGTFEFDAHLATSPTSQRYTIHQSGNYGTRGFVTSGTSGNHAIVRSNAGGGHGYFSTNGQLFGGRYITTYTDFTAIGDATHAAFEMGTPAGIIDGVMTWDATHDTFSSSGQAPAATCSLAATDIFRHDFNVHTGSLGPSIFTRPDLCGGIQALTTGVREVIGNVTDETLDTNLDAYGFTIHSNYLGNTVVIAGGAAHTWAIFENNFYTDLELGGGTLSTEGDVANNLFFLDAPNLNNPHVIFPGSAAASSIFGNILDVTGTLSVDSGEFVLTNIPLFHGGQYGIFNNILLPAAPGYATTEITSVQDFCGSDPPTCSAQNVGTTFLIDHNTYAGQKNTTPGNQDALHVGEALLVKPGTIASYQGNLIWIANPAFASWKMVSAGTSVVDPCAPADCDYNAGWNTLPGGGGFTGGANGYAYTFSSPPGVHDRSDSPMLVDSTRNTATFDSAYLGNHPIAWSGGATYTVGDMVSSSDASVYYPSVINYRWVNKTGCSGNPQPGLYNSTSRACWEWASLYRLRQGVAAQTLYDDPVIGAHGVDIITTLIQWIRTGYSPSNPAYALAAKDGKDIGAVPVSFTAPGFITPSSTQTTMRGGKARGGIVR